MSQKNKLWKFRVNLGVKLVRATVRNIKIHPSVPYNRKQTRQIFAERYRVDKYPAKLEKLIRLLKIGDQYYVKIKGVPIQGRAGWISAITEQEADKLGLYVDTKFGTKNGLTVVSCIDDQNNATIVYMVILTKDENNEKQPE